MISSRWKKHLEDQNFSSNKSEENDTSKIDFLAQLFSRKKILEAQKKISRAKKLENFLRGISSRFFLDIVHLEVFVPRIYSCILEDAVLIKKIFLYNNHLFVLKVDKSILRITILRFQKYIWANVRERPRTFTKVRVKNVLILFFYTFQTSKNMIFLVEEISFM